jgi:Winged helix-turn helix
MKAPIFVRSFSEKERERLEAGLRSKNTFTLRRSQMLLASPRGDKVAQIAENLGCGRQTVRDAIHDFNERGVDALAAKSSRPRRTRDAFDEESAEALRGLLHRVLRGSLAGTRASGRSRWQRRSPSRRGSHEGRSPGRRSERRSRASSE